MAGLKDSYVNPVLGSIVPEASLPSTNRETVKRVDPINVSDKSKIV